MLKMLSPGDVLKRVSDALPDQSKQNMIIIGSLAAGYYFSHTLRNVGVRTKDVDCMIWPHASAKVLVREVAEELIEHGWKLEVAQAYPISYDENTEIEKLPMVRLRPAGEVEWFLELLNSPNAQLVQEGTRSAEKLKTKHGYFALCGFKYLSLVEVDPIPTNYQIPMASPQMMALANLLHHPRIGEEKIGTTNVKCSNKDLGRVLALAYLMNESKEDLQIWPQQWLAALEVKFPNEVRSLTLRCGAGLRELLVQEYDLDQAVKTCNSGLLANHSVTNEQLRVTAERFLADVIQPFERLVQ